jgi:hypothetical protein
MKWWSWLMLVYLAPLLAMSGYIAFAPRGSEAMYWITLGFLLAAGIVAVWATPWQRRAKVAVSLGYVPLMGIALVVASFVVQCSTRSCL